MLQFKHIYRKKIVFDLHFDCIITRINHNIIRGHIKRKGGFYQRSYKT